jgi:hypothetical protein
MKNKYISGILFTLGMSVTCTLFSQSIAINTSGNAADTSVLLDLSNRNTPGNSGFLPPYVTLTSSTVLSPISGSSSQLSGLLVYNVSTSTAGGLSGPGLYYWNNSLTPASWVYLGGGGAASANNGVSIGGGSVQLGGNPLIQATSITLSGNSLSVSGSLESINFTSTGQVGFGNSTPNAKAIVDLTNTATTPNLGMMLPNMSTANLPPITAAQNGLIVFNTTTGCPEMAYNGTWYRLGFPAAGSGSVTFTGQAITYWTVPPCVTTLTIVAKGASGTLSGGEGAIVTANGVSVTPGEVLGIACGQVTAWQWMGEGGGGGSFVWNTASTSVPIVAAGGGGGGAPEGSGYNASLTTTPTGTGSYVGAGGSGGTAGTVPTGCIDPGGAGGGWLTNHGNPPSPGVQYGAGGVGLPGGLLGGAAAYAGGLPPTQGGFGGGGGGGADASGAYYGGGGGGGGYNGGGGGYGNNSDATEYPGGGGGSCVNGVTPVSPNTATLGNTGSGSVTITW